MSTTITAPGKYTGATAIGPTVLDFTDGTATTDVVLPDGTVAYLLRRGYKVDQENTGDQDTAPGSTELDGLTVAQLRDHAAEHGIDLGEASKKADIVAIIDATPAGTANVGGAQ